MVSNAGPFIAWPEQLAALRLRYRELSYLQAGLEQPRAWPGVSDSFAPVTFIILAALPVAAAISGRT